MFFFKFSNINVLLDKKTLMWKIYTTNKVLSTTNQVQIINKKNFVLMTLNVNN